MLRSGLAALRTATAARLSTSAPALKVVVKSPDAPAPIGPFSQGIRSSGPFLFCSGTIPIDPKTGKIVGADVQAQTEQVLKNLGAVLVAGGASFDSCVKTTVFLTDMAHFAQMNEVYARYFKTSPPARACYAVKGLPMGALVEIEAIAEVPK
eukprot:Amastigsp_a842397_95.p1 type:complete len:152 gc:universal Amastigsp_a842397_95:464-9(-)